MENWYKRIENNGWRPVSTKHLLQMNLDYYYGVETSNPVVFNHSNVCNFLRTALYLYYLY